MSRVIKDVRVKVTTSNELTYVLGDIPWIEAQLPVNIILDIEEKALAQALEQELITVTDNTLLLTPKGQLLTDDNVNSRTHLHGASFTPY